MKLRWLVINKYDGYKGEPTLQYKESILTPWRNVELVELEEKEWERLVLAGRIE